MDEQNKDEQKARLSNDKRIDAEQGTLSSGDKRRDDFSTTADDAGTSPDMLEQIIAEDRRQQYEQEFNQYLESNGFGSHAKTTAESVQRLREYYERATKEDSQEHVIDLAEFRQSVWNGQI